MTEPTPIPSDRTIVSRPAGPTGGRLVAMWLVMILLTILAPVAMVLGYYAFQKLTYPAYACGSFGQLDGEIGWTLRPSARSCLGARAAFSSGPPWYQAPVYTDRNGFRAAQTGGDTPVGGIMAVGDSFTFGYGVNFAQSFAAQLADVSGVPTVAVASPAYSSAQALSLAQRWIGRLRPRAIVFLEMGAWERGACRGATRPTAISKPCYWQPPGAASAELVLPPPGRVDVWSRWGVLPGGIIGVGETGWDYFLITRPVYLGLGLLARLNLVPGFANDFAAVGVDAEIMRRTTVHQLAELARSAAVPVILLDPKGFFPADSDRDFGQAPFKHVDPDLWQASVTEPARLLPSDQQFVPHDAHFGPGTNHLIAVLLAREFRRLGVEMNSGATR
jgi:hypothetical protein